MASSSAMSHSVAGRACVIDIGEPMAAGVSVGLTELGWRVSTLTDLGETRAACSAAVDEAVGRDGVPDLVIVSIIPFEAARIAGVTAVSASDWRAGPRHGLKLTLWLLQAWGRHLKPKGGAIVFVAPSLSLVGGADMVPLTTLLEGQRGLMKSVARQWGAFGVTLNWIAAAPRALSHYFDDTRLAAKPDAVSVALGRPADPAREIAPVLVFLGSPAGRAITGATIPVDGGEWMVP